MFKSKQMIHLKNIWLRVKILCSMLYSMILKQLHNQLKRKGANKWMVEGKAGKNIENKNSIVIWCNLTPVTS